MAADFNLHEAENGNMAQYSVERGGNHSLEPWLPSMVYHGNIGHSRPALTGVRLT